MDQVKQDPTLGDPARQLAETLGGIDIYLLDQVLRGRVAPGARVLDAGAGGGRNCRWFLAHGYDVHGLDPAPGAIENLRAMAAELSPTTTPAELAERFRAESLEATTLPLAAFDLVILNAVLHFAADQAQFDALLEAAFARVARGGLLFARLATSIGLPTKPLALGGGRFRLPDGSDRYLADEVQLRRAEERLGAERLDPLKTTNVQNLRCMTTWVLGKGR